MTGLTCRWMTALRAHPRATTMLKPLPWGTDLESDAADFGICQLCRIRGAA